MQASVGESTGGHGARDMGPPTKRHVRDDKKIDDMLPRMGGDSNKRRSVSKNNSIYSTPKRPPKKRQTVSIRSQDMSPLAEEGPSLTLSLGSMCSRRCPSRSWRASAVWARLTSSNARHLASATRSASSGVTVL